jgi:hypothetical protein
LVATAYAYDGDPDDAIQRPGAIGLFDTATARLLRDRTTARTDSSPASCPTVASSRSRAKVRRLIDRAREPSWSR